MKKHQKMSPDRKKGIVTPAPDVPLLPECEDPTYAFQVEEPEDDVEKLLHERLKTLNSLREKWTETKTVKIAGLPFLKELPKDFFEEDVVLSREVIESLECIVLSRNSLEHFPLHMLRCRSLVTLCLNNNRIDTVPPEIHYLVNLQYLDLSFNMVKRLPSEMFKLTRLRSLNCKANSISKLPKEIGNCRSLKHVEVSNNHIEKIPKTIGKLSNLEIFVANDNLQIVLCQEISQCSKLKSLIIERNGMKEFPDISKLVNLESFVFNRNSLSVFCDFSSMEQLTGIYMSHNHLEFIPDEMLSQKSVLITTVDLSSNNFKEFPLPLTKLKNLLQLELSGNPITSIPEEVNRLSKLKRLLLVKCKIIKFPDVLEMPDLEELIADRNLLQNLNEKCFTKLQKLLFLNISRNRIVEIPSMGSLVKVVHIDMSKNRIRRIPEDIKNCAKLQVIDFSYNRIEQLCDSMEEMVSLTRLIVNDNDISVAPNHIAKVKSLSYVDFRENPFLEKYKRATKKARIEFKDSDVLLEKEDFEKKLLEHLEGRNLDDILELPKESFIVCKLQ